MRSRIPVGHPKRVELFIQNRACGSARVRRRRFLTIKPVRKAVKAAAMAHGFRRLQLTVSDDNEAAKCLYREAGFKLKSAHVGYQLIECLLCGHGGGRSGPVL